MTNFTAQLLQFKNFDNTEDFTKAFNLFRKKYRYELTQSDNKVLFTMSGYAVKFIGACKMQLATLASAADVSLATVKRAISKAVKLGIIKRFKTRKDNGRRQGATVYQFQQFNSELQNEPQTMSHRQNDEKPCESKTEDLKNDAESLSSLSPSLSYKDTNTTNADAQTKLKDGLLSKLPVALADAVKPFFKSSEQLYQLVGTIFNAKSKVDKSVRIEDHEQVFYKSIVSVFSSWKRGKINNVFAVMHKAIRETTEAIVNGTAYVGPTAFTQVKQSKEQIPAWFKKPQVNEVDDTIDFEAERAKILAQLQK